MALTSDQVKNIAALANLELTKREVEKFRTQLTEVIDFNAGELSKIDTEKIEPLLSVSGLTNVERLDVTEPGFSQKEALSNAKDKHNGFFKVKAILY